MDIKNAETITINIALGTMSNPDKDISRNDVSNLDWLCDSMPDRDGNITTPGMMYPGIVKSWQTVLNAVNGRLELEIVIELVQ